MIIHSFALYLGSQLIQKQQQYDFGCLCEQWLWITASAEKPGAWKEKHMHLFIIYVAPNPRNVNIDNDLVKFSHLYFVSRSACLLCMHIMEGAY